MLNYRTRDRGPRCGRAVPGDRADAHRAATRRRDVLDDDWTVVTADGSRAAHWEHSVAVPDDGLWVLTARDGGDRPALAPFGVAVAPLTLD